MLKRPITYTDFNDEEQTDVVYFNLSKSELLELELSSEGGLGNALTKIIEAKDHATLVEWFKKVILGAYGEKSADGKKFTKSDELRKEFSQTAAYEALFMELASSEDAAAAFINGIVPKDMAELLESEKLKNDTARKIGATAAAAQAASEA